MKKKLAVILSMIFTCIFVLQPYLASPLGGAVCAEAAALEAKRFASVACGYGHMAAIDTNGNLWVWGYNSSGQVGNGTQEDALTPQLIMSNVKSVSLGDDSTAVIDTDNNLWIWGWQGSHFDIYGEDQLHPTKVMSNIASVSLGDSHGLAVDTSGNLWAWGYNSKGQLADGTTVGQYDGAKLVRRNVVSAYAGDYFSGYIDTNGDLWMCGDNNYGQIGIGEKSESVVTPVRVLQNVVSASMSFTTTMVVTKSGDLYTWGGSTDDDLGRDAENEPYRPGKAAGGIKSVSTRWSHAAALDTAGNLWTCGYECYGELLDGEKDGILDRFTKVKSGVASASAGEYNTAYIDTDGRLWVVGRNNHGQLGNGTCGEDSYSLVPIQVTGAASINEYGDVNGNGKVEASDALMVLRHVVSLITLEGAQQTAADVDGSGTIDASDALQILRRVVNLIDHFSVER